MTAIPPRVGFHHTSVFVDDVDQTIKFYTEGLGLTVHYDFPGINVAEGPLAGKEIAPRGALVQCSEGIFVEIFPRPRDAESQSPAFPLNHIALRVENIEEAYERALAHGAKPHALDIEEQPWDGTPLKIEFQGEPRMAARIAFVLGPDRELIELFEEVPAA